MEAKEALKIIWNFLWNDESIWSWIISLILAFIIVKFIFFPLLSFAFATGMPLVVVESGSMHHPGSFLGNTFGSYGNFNIWWSEKGQWYQSRNFTKEQASEWKFRTGLEIGDIVLLSGYGKPKVGDIIIFYAGTQYPIIHRVMEIKEINGKIYYSTKGDNNSDQLSQEKLIAEDAVIGKALLKIPKLGWIKLGIVRLFQ